MRRLALGLAVLWLLLAFGLRLRDMRRPQIYVSALTGGQRHHEATLAWIEGTMPGAATPSRGWLIVADVRIDGKLLRFASVPLPSDWADCRLWLEESPDVIQAVARCPHHAPVRLTAAGTSVPGLGPDHRPATLYALHPLTSVEPERIVNKVHRHHLAPTHPWLFVLGVLAMLPLGVLTWQTLRKAWQLRRKPTLEGVLEHAEPGSLTIRSGDRRVSVFVEQGEVISIGLGKGRLYSDATMAVDGLRATVQGKVDSSTEGGFRGQETMRLRPGAVLVVGGSVDEAHQRLLLAALRDGALALAGIATAATVAMGLAW
ncbi:MAG: hypothetical protein RMK29_06600 [Myxococcales bacterium]|nr:hypothetical protein [Myxococcota bacterium]MDW8281363.1 hypothetical protein [Myxococcales bacterium]